MEVPDRVVSNLLRSLGNSPDVIDGLADYTFLQGDTAKHFVNSILKNKSHFILLYGTSNSGKSFFTRKVIEHVARRKDIRIFILKPSYEEEDLLFEKLAKEAPLIRAGFNHKSAMVIEALIDEESQKIKKAVESGKKSAKPVETLILLDDVQCLETEAQQIAFNKLVTVLARSARHSGFKTILNVQSLIDIEKRVRSNVTSLVCTLPINDSYREDIRTTFHRTLNSRLFAKMKLPKYSLLVKHTIGGVREIFLSTIKGESP